jgi:hypothetical protein
MTDFLEEIGWVLDGFSAEERAVSRAVFRRILDGEAVRAGSLAPLLGLAAATVDAAVAGLIERGTMARDPGSVGGRARCHALPARVHLTAHQLLLLGRAVPHVGSDGAAPRPRGDADGGRRGRAEALGAMR